MLRTLFFCFSFGTLTIRPSFFCLSLSLSLSLKNSRLFSFQNPPPAGEGNLGEGEAVYIDPIDTTGG